MGSGGGKSEWYDPAGFFSDPAPQTSSTTPTVPSWISGGQKQFAGRLDSLFGTPQTKTAANGGTFDEQSYLAANPDVAQFSRGALAHWNEYGQKEGRLGAYGPQADPSQPYVSPEEAWAKTWTGPTDQQNQAFSFKGQDIDPALSGFDPGSIAGTDLTQYTNPYDTQVRQNALSDLDRFRQGAITQNQDAATKSGAFGGSRHGIADSETNRNYIDQAGSLSSGLLQSGYQNAQLAAQQDVNNRLSGAQFRLGAQNTSATNSRANASLLADLGEQQRMLLAAKNPNSFESLQALSGLLGYNPSMYVGQNGTGSAPDNSGQNAQAAGGLITAGASLF